jgi:hypothetical protein
VVKKNERDNRRAIAEQLRNEQRRKERMRSGLILGVCILVVLGLLGTAVTVYVRDMQKDKKIARTPLSGLGVSRAAAGCDPLKTTPTDKTQEHIPAPTPIPYKDAPPSFGAHRPQPAGLERQFYDARDRPEVAVLVHNLEHGYTILWYDDSVAADKAELKVIESIANKYQGDRFIAAPWTESDGAAFPDGKHIALTRWSADAKDPSDESKQRGNWEYCTKTSGTVVSEFSKRWTNAQSPEPGIM